MYVCMYVCMHLENAVLTQEERLLIVHRLHEVLRPFMLRRVKDQVLDQLPEKVERVLKCNLSGWQRKMYQSIANKGLAIKVNTYTIVCVLSNHLPSVCTYSCNCVIVMA